VPIAALGPFLIDVFHFDQPNLVFWKHFSRADRVIAEKHAPLVLGD